MLPEEMLAMEIKVRADSLRLSKQGKATRTTENIFLRY